MKGRHDVRVFVTRGQEVNLPDGWKPFSAEYEGGLLTVVARRWTRIEDATVSAQSPEKDQLQQEA